MTHLPGRPDYSLLQYSGLPATYDRGERQWDRLRSRNDRFAFLMASGRETQFKGHLATQRSIRSDNEQEELARLAGPSVGKYKRELQEDTEALRDLVRRLTADSILPLVAFLNSFVVQGTYFEPADESSELLIETVAAMTLESEPSSGTAATVSDVREIERLWSRLCDTRFLLRSAELLSEDDADEAFLRLRMNEQWEQLRGDTYVQHGRDLAIAIYGGRSSSLLTNVGFDMSDLVEFSETFVRLMNERVNEVVGEALNSGIATGLIELLERDGEIVHGVTEALVLSKDVQVTALPRIPAERLDALLLRLTAHAPEETASDIFGLWRRNPIRSRPLVRLEHGWMLPAPGYLLREFYTLLEKDALTSPSFSKHRASVLDDLATEFVANALGTSEKYTSLYYRLPADPLTQYEMDGLVLFNGYAIVLEGKASQMAEPARNGDSVRLQRELKNVVEKAIDQAERDRNYLLSGGDAVFTDESGRNVLLTVPSGSVKFVYAIMPTLHSYGPVHVVLDELRKVGWLSKKTPVWSVFINDLRITAEMLANPALFLHFLDWRLRVPLGVRVIAAEELDLLGAYMFGKLHELETMRPNDMLFIQSGTSDFDRYYLEAAQGHTTERPEKQLPPSVAEYVNNPPAPITNSWLRNALALLDLSLMQQTHVEMALSRGLDGNQQFAVHPVDGVDVVVLAEQTSWVNVALSAASQLTAEIAVIGNEADGKIQISGVLGKSC
jgi:hypothetical protein